MRKRPSARLLVLDPQERVLLFRFRFDTGPLAGTAYWATPGGKKLVEMLPRKRVGDVKDLDGLVMLLASGEARFINGAIIAADDGLSIT